MYLQTAIHQRLFELYERHQVQAEQHMILHNLESAIITTNGDAIKYFNESAKQIIDKAVDGIQNEDEKAKCVDEVRQIDKAIRNLKNTATECEHKTQTRKKILETTVFREYDRTKHNDPRSQLGQSYSLQQLFQMDRQLLKSKTFVFVAHRDAEQQEAQGPPDRSRRRFFQISFNKLTIHESEICMLKIRDVTITIQFDLSIGEKRLLELVNACVSHEMRNPINAIFGMNLKMRGLIQSFFEFLAARNGLDQDEEAQALKKQFEEAIQVQESASKLLNFYVADLLCLAQIEKGTFRKNISSFDLREAI